MWYVVVTRQVDMTEVAVIDLSSQALGQRIGCQE